MATVPMKILRIPLNVQQRFLMMVINADATAKEAYAADPVEAESTYIDRAYEIIRGVIDKYVAAGVYWVVVDNNLNEWSPSLHSKSEM